jgi:DNA-binding MarR family transcriptional regulator|tara:strand:+ start:89 stop:535 length:447 start_codon:yes stop_codon:yes gene_type:complete
MTDKTIDHVLRATWQAVAKSYNEEAINYGATMAIAFTLLNIDKDGTASTTLGPKMGMEATSLSRTLKNMEEKGLIYRKKNPNDGRSVLIFLTDYGIDMRNISREKVYSFNETINKNLSPEKIANFHEVSNTIVDLIQQRKIFNKKQTS